MFVENIDYDLNLEASVLGICVNDASAFGRCYNLLIEECFHNLDHMQLFKIMYELFNSGYPIDMLTVIRYYGKLGIIKVGDGTPAYFVANLSQSILSDAHVEFWAKDLRDLAAQRLMITYSHTPYDYTKSASENATDRQEKLRRIAEVRVADDWLHISDVVKKLDTHMQEMAAGKELGLTTSFSELDAINGGFRPDNLIIIGARPSVGKSALMGRIATHVAAKGKVVGIISLEMGDSEILGRLVSAESDIDHSKIDRNKFCEWDIKKDVEERAKVYEILGSMSKLPIYFSDAADVNWNDIRAKAHKLQAKHGLDILLIDYLQLVEPEADKKTIREQEVAKISRGAKKLAKSMHIPIVMLAQLNRSVNEKGDKKPELHHLRESGSIEQDADVVMFLHRDWMSGITTDAQGASTESSADILIRKWRNGTTMDMKIGFNGPKMKFYELDGEKKNNVFDNPSAGITRPAESKLFIPGGFQPRSPLPVERDTTQDTEPNF